MRSLRWLFAVLALTCLVLSPAEAAEPPTTQITTPDGSIFVHTIATPATVQGYSVGANSDVQEVVVDFVYSLSTPAAAYTAHCGVFMLLVPSQSRVDWSAQLCTPLGINPPPPFGKVLVTAHAVDNDGDIEAPGPSISILVV